MENREILTPYEGKINAQSGVVVDLRNPTVKMINANDIVCALSKICRFNGQISHFYSVAQHSVLVESLAPPALKRAALIHDCAEAYIQDIISPLKNMLDKSAIGYRHIEDEFNRVIFDFFGEPIDNLRLVKEYDLKAYQMEKEAFKNGFLTEWHQYWLLNMEYEVSIWNPNYAAKWFAKHLERRFPSLNLNLKLHY
jgi:5'-deoxynucleotidase YfbR-like HD superfamily hydrolase